MRLQYLKNMDIFSHQVGLNFDKNGGYHGTFCGGFSSIIFWVAIIVISATKLNDNSGKFS